MRYVGLSNHPAWQLTHALWIADDRRLSAPVCAQVKYSLLERAPEGELVPACLMFGLSIVAYAPLHGGLLASTQVLERPVHGDKRFAGAGFSEAEVGIGRTVERLGQDWGLRPYQVSLAWLLSRPALALGHRRRRDCGGAHRQCLGGGHRAGASATRHPHEAYRRRGGLRRCRPGLLVNWKSHETALC